MKEVKSARAPAYTFDSSRPKVVAESKPWLLIGGLWPVEPNPKKAATFKVSSQPAESRQHYLCVFLGGILAIAEGRVCERKGPLYCRRCDSVVAAVLETLT